MAEMVQAKKKIALLHRHPASMIKETNAAFPYLAEKGIDVLTFKEFDRTGDFWKFWKSLFWIFWAPLLVIGKGYDVIYCDDSYPFYPALVKMVSPHSKVVARIGDFHLMYNYSGRVYKILHFFEKIAWQNIDAIFAISKEMSKKIEDETHWVDVYTILDPIDLDQFKYEKSQSYQSAVVMFHGLITKNKNIDLMIAAAKRMPEISFWVVGDGPDLKRLQFIAPKNVWFSGWVSMNKVKEMINECGVGLALRSNNPGNEYVVTSPFLQYGALGKPCLVTRRKVFGTYPWQFSTVDEMVKKIRTLLNNPKEGLRLKEHIVKNHDARKIAEEIWLLLSS